MQDAPKAVWSLPYVSVAFFPSLKHNSIAYRSSKASSRPDCIFEIHQLLQPGFSRVYSNCCCSCSFETEIIKIGQSSHKTYSNNTVNLQESTMILNAHMKKVSSSFISLQIICQWGLEYANCISCRRVRYPQKRWLECGTKPNLLVRHLFWRSWVYRVLIHSHYSQVHSDPEW